jgi:transcriptional regulator with XRE-family HTH domain
MPLDEKRKSLTAKEKKLIENIKRTRQKLSVTQEDLSYRIGKNSNYMGMVESFRRGISFKTLFRVADALKVKVEKFFENL